MEILKTCKDWMSRLGKRYISSFWIRFFLSKLLCVYNILPYLKISEKVWVSISVDNVRQHDINVLEINELDCNEELNYWYDCHVAYKKLNTMNFQVMLPVIEKERDIIQYSVPKCAIKCYGVYNALLCYLSAIRNKSIHTRWVSNCDVYSIGMSERREDQETLLTILEEENKKLYQDKSLKIDDPFRKDKLCSHYKNCLIKNKEKDILWLSEKS